MINENLKFSRMSLPDISEVLKIADECKLEFWSERDYLEEIKRDDSLLVAARLDGLITGFICARLIIFEQPNGAVETENKSANNGRNGFAEIFNIGVRSSTRGKGVGTALLRKLVAECSKAGLKLVRLEVRASEKEAVAFYIKNGFEIAGQRKNFYSRPADDAVLMDLTL